jgi:hypothetical protein
MLLTQDNLAHLCKEASLESWQSDKSETLRAVLVLTLSFFIVIHYHHADYMSLNESKFNIHCFSLPSVSYDFPNSQCAFSTSDETLAV